MCDCGGKKISGRQMAPIHSYSGYRRRTVAANAPFRVKRAGLAFRDYFCRDDRLYRGESAAY